MSVASDPPADDGATISSSAGCPSGLRISRFSLQEGQAYWCRGMTATGKQEETVWQKGQTKACVESDGEGLGERLPWCLTTLRPGVLWTVPRVERSVIIEKDSAKR